jgi:Predicted helicase
MSSSNSSVNLFETYLNELRKHHQEKTELSDRPHLKNLLEGITATLEGNPTLLHEPKRHTGGFGAPDFQVKSGENILGYIEVKKIGEPLEPLIHSEQIKKYKHLSSNILLTNYIDFIWLKGDAPPKGASLGSSTQLFLQYHKIKQEDAEAVEAQIKDFFSVPPKGITKAKDLAAALAPRSQRLRDFFIDQLKQQERDHKGILFELYDAFKRKVFKDFRTEEFANVFAQMVAYGIFLARLNTDGKTHLDVNNAQDYIPHNFELIHQLVRFLDYLNKDKYKEIKWIVDEIFSIINTFDLEAIQRDFSFSTLKNNTAHQEAIIEKDPYIYFYEDFLTEFDNDLRRQMGVYYTPLPIVRFIIQGVEDILQGTFEIKDGFANSKVTALDFATGTGTFLIELFRHALQNLPKDSGKRNHIIKSHLLQDFYGFEYMIAPYTIAHLKLSEFLKEEGYELQSDDRLGVYLTNTLESLENEDNQLIPGLSALNAEGEKAQEIKKQDILVIVGNPPYSGVSRNDTPGLIDAYKYVEGKSINEKKHWLNDDYVKFIRFAQQKMDAVSEGVVGIITNHGFLDNPTFRGMRASLLETFDQIYIVNLHGNAKKKEVCPDGSKDENIFDIQMGTCITFFIKKPGVKKGVFYTDLWGSREGKFKACTQETIASLKWSKIPASSPTYLFIPWQVENEALYNSFWSIKEIFAESSVGIVTGRDSLTIDFDADILLERVKDFSLLTPEIASEKYKLSKDSCTWQIVLAQDNLKQTSLTSDHIKNLAYRPFDTRKIYYTNKSKGFIARPLYKIMRHMLAGDNVGLVFNRNNQGIRCYNHAFISNTLIDGHLHGGLAYCTPLYLYPELSSNNQNTLFPSESAATERIENFTLEFRKWIDAHYDHSYSPEEILGYIYATLHSPTYRDKYLAFLKMDFPRIPFTKNRKDFEDLSTLGWQLIQTHLMKDIPGLDMGDYIGQGDHKVEKIHYDAKEKKLFINPTQYFAKVPSEVWKFYIGGYQVLDKYLKSRKGCVLSIEEIENIEKVTKILAFTIKQMQAIDALYPKVEA